MGKRNRRPGIMESLERDIAIQVSMNEVREMFADGKPHEVTFFDAIFLDGQALTTEVHQPTVMHKSAASFEEFGEVFNQFTKALTSVQREVLYADMAAIRACAKAGLALVIGMYQGNEPSESTREAATILGNMLGIPSVERLESALDLPDELRKTFVEYANKPWPLIGENAPEVLKGFMQARGIDTEPSA